MSRHHDAASRAAVAGGLAWREIRELPSGARRLLLVPVRGQGDQHFPWAMCVNGKCLFD